MSLLNIKSKAACRWDFLALGEVLLRFCPGDERIHNARNFRVFDGGAEYNVARNLAKVFRQNTGIVTALADNALGRLAEDFVLQGGVEASEICLAGIRRQRRKHQKRHLFYRARFRTTRSVFVFRPREYGCCVVKSGRHRLAKYFRRKRRTLVSHRRSFYRTFRDNAADSRGSNAGGARIGRDCFR